MIIGFTGLLCSNKESIINAFKTFIPEEKRSSFIYIDLDKKMSHLVNPDTPSYNQLKENMSSEMWTEYEDRGVLYYYRNKKLYANPKAYKIFVDTLRPYMTCKLAKILAYFNEKNIVLFGNHLLDYEWKDFCDRIIVIDRPQLERNKKFFKYKLRGDKNIAFMDSQFLSREELLNKGDWIIKCKNDGIPKKEIQKMTEELLQFQKFLEKGMIPAPSKNIIEICKNILNECYNTYAPQMAAAMSAKKIAEFYGYHININFTGELENHRDVVGGPLQNGEISTLKEKAIEKKKLYKKRREEEIKLGIPTDKEILAKKRKEKAERRKQARIIKKKKEIRNRKSKNKRKNYQKKSKNSTIQNKKKKIIINTSYNFSRMKNDKNLDNAKYTEYK